MLPSLSDLQKIKQQPRQLCRAAVAMERASRVTIPMRNAPRPNRHRVTLGEIDKMRLRHKMNTIGLSPDALSPPRAEDMVPSTVTTSSQSRANDSVIDDVSTQKELKGREDNFYHDSSSTESEQLGDESEEEEVSTVAITQQQQLKTECVDLDEEMKDSTFLPNDESSEEKQTTTGPIQMPTQQKSNCSVRCQASLPPSLPSSHPVDPMCDHCKVSFAPQIRPKTTPGRFVIQVDLCGSCLPNAVATLTQLTNFCRTSHHVCSGRDMMLDTSGCNTQASSPLRQPSYTAKHERTIKEAVKTDPSRKRNHGDEEVVFLRVVANKR